MNSKLNKQSLKATIETSNVILMTVVGQNGADFTKKTTAPATVREVVVRMKDVFLFQLPTAPSHFLQERTCHSRNRTGRSDHLTPPESAHK